MRQRDLLSSLGTDYWITTSRVVQQRVAKTYRRSSVIIPPPVDVSRFDLKVSRQGYFLMLMRLVGWKRPEIVIEACNRLGFPLVVAGDGRELARLKALAGPTVTFAGRVNDEQMRVLYADCRALILPAEEDFGITPLEAMASGKPVIAYRAGGALDTVVPGKTGMFFKQQSTDFLMEALTEFNPADFDAALIRRHAERYDSVNFRRKMLEFIRSAYSHYCTGGALVDSQLPSVEAPKPVSAAAV
jgi:glycosyltransferase involved in cell wall biosynthesis